MAALTDSDRFSQCIPLTRRLQAFGGNERGGEIQFGQIRHYVEAN